MRRVHVGEDGRAADPPARLQRLHLEGTRLILPKKRGAGEVSALERRTSVSCPRGSKVHLLVLLQLGREGVVDQINRDQLRQADHQITVDQGRTRHA